jgi:tRNA pseudouridine55 synthase
MKSGALFSLTWKPLFEQMNGFIIVDKPAGMTSHDVVYAVRRMTGVKKVGHTGTLDPFATGVLPIALGEGTKAIPFLDEARKEYRAVLRLGEVTDTQDLTGELIENHDWRGVTPETINAATAMFTGRIKQVPPMFSALKHKGVPLYRLARRGVEITREPREIEVFSMLVERLDLPEVSLTVNCSRGTYVRTLAHDMGVSLGCGAHLVRLQRTVSGPFDLSMAMSLDRLAALAATGEIDAVIITPYDALSHLHDFQVNESGRAKVACGVTPKESDLNNLPAAHLSRGERVRISHGKRLLAVAEMIAENGWNMRIARVFN